MHLRPLAPELDASEAQCARMTIAHAHDQGVMHWSPCQVMGTLLMPLGVLCRFSSAAADLSVYLKKNHFFHSNFYDLFKIIASEREHFILTGRSSFDFFKVITSVMKV